jgi:Ca-activated chloride channel family protein
LITAVDGLNSIDRFNIIWFNNDTGSLFPETIDASAEYKSYAKRFINNLDADGGTEMKPALQLALSGQETFSRFRQVIFITDGNIDNEIELFDIIDRQLGNSRLFTIGIGSAPNSYFMRKAAQKGHGTFTYIGDINEVNTKTTALFKKIEMPALINIQLTIDGNSDEDEYEVFPKTIADMYAGETTTLFIKGKDIPESIAIRGDYGNTEWQSSTELKTTSKEGISIAWAREKIASLMDKLHEVNGRAGNETVARSIRQQVTDTALEHHLVSRYTSMVAVDVTPVNSDGMLYRERLKNNLPRGWKNRTSTDGIMLAQAATGSRLNLLLAIVLFITATFLYRWRYR